MKKTLFIGRDAVSPLVRLGRDEALELTLITLPGTSADTAIEVALDGEGAHLTLNGIFLCSGADSSSLKVNVRHNAPKCTSNQLFRGIAGGSAKASFDGLIYVARGASGTKADQQCNTLLLSHEAVCESKPQLEIYNDDVECSHGAASGFLANDELFYMRSRGIPEAEAKKMQMISFLAPVTAGLDGEDAKTVNDSIDSLL